MLLSEYSNNALYRRIKQNFLDNDVEIRDDIMRDIDVSTLRNKDSYSPSIHVLRYISSEVHKKMSDVHDTFYHISPVKPEIILKTGLKCTDSTSKRATHNVNDYSEKRLYFVSIKEIMCERAIACVLRYSKNFYKKNDKGELTAIDTVQLQQDINYWCKVIKSKGVSNKSLQNLLYVIRASFEDYESIFYLYEVKLQNGAYHIDQEYSYDDIDINYDFDNDLTLLGACYITYSVAPDKIKYVGIVKNYSDLKS